MLLRCRDAWGRLMQPHSATKVWMYTEGNHERELTNGVKDWVAYTTRCGMGLCLGSWLAFRCL